MKKNSFVIFFERLLFHTAPFFLRKNKIQSSYPHLAEGAIFTVTMLKTPYGRPDSTNTDYVPGTVLGVEKQNK